MEIFVNPPKEQWNELMARVSVNDSDIAAIVADILHRVKEGGDAAIRQIATEVEGFCPVALQVSEEEIAAAEEFVSAKLQRAINAAARNIREFHQAQRPVPVEIETMSGVMCRRRAMPIEKVGLYIPGGSAPLFSTLLMLAIPAKLAGCKEIVLCTPCGKDGQVNPAVLYAASVCGVNRIYKIGGAQAIAAMAYGTETVPKVMKIFGPGNRFVTKAKQQVSAAGVAIDMPAGPSEVMVMADENARVSFVASDLLSQAEHGPDSQAILVCNDEILANEVYMEVEAQAEELPRREIVEKALENSRIVVFDDVDTMVEFANGYASEHLIINMEDPWSVADRITAAGSVFIGPYSPESAGDYASGTNHTLPTMGWAASYSGVGLDSFLHYITYQELSKKGLLSLSNVIISMADAEGLTAHGNAVKVRLYNNKIEKRYDD
ncbi:MAG: histidinol dehydrogenase [Bacteroidales bacterium]|nr:histidinol dehydrogenase [Bacteroidales bacterium]MBO7487852.1 histidinol dehydrogenase [Bacteroidales bacterium]